VADKSETLLAVCVLRAAMARARGKGVDVENAPAPKKREALRLLVSATPKASRVASLVVLWALALEDLDADDLTLTEWNRWANVSERTAWRQLAEFRELFHEFETPTPLALQIRRELRRRKGERGLTQAAMNFRVRVAT
jgi:hypothetical protein